MLGLDVLPDPGPARPGAGAGLPGAALRDRQPSRCSRSPRGACAGSAGRRCGTRWCSACCTASRRSCRPPGSRTRRPASRASSPGCTSSPPRCSPPLLLRSRITPGDLGWPSRSRWAASAVLTLSGLSVGYGRRSRSWPRCSTRCTSSGSAPGATPREAIGMAIVQLVMIALVCVRRDRPGRDRAAVDRPATGCRSSTWRCSPARWRWSAQTWAQAHLAAHPHGDHHEHGAGVRGPVRGAPGRRVGDRRGCWSAALMVLAAMLVVELAPRRRIEAEVPHIVV